MTLNKILKKYKSIKDINLIGKEIIIKDELCEVMGLYICDSRLNLLLLEYDEKLIEYENDLKEACHDYKRIITNRTKKQQHISRPHNTVIGNIKEIIIDDVAYEVEGRGGTRATLSDYENTLIFSLFFEKGWQPQSVGKIEIENCILNTVRFKGKFNEMPKFNNHSKIIFKFNDSHNSQIVEQPITLEVGKEYNEKIYFKTKDTEEVHWIYINDVSVYDMLTETMKNFENPKLIECLNNEELIQMKIDTEKSILEICPKGKGVLSIEYESDCDQQIVFYSKEWLESQPIHKNSSSAFIARSDKKTGKLGKHLRVALFNEPLEFNTKDIECEIFLMHKETENKDFVL